MRIHVRLFAAARQLAGAEAVEVEVAAPANIAALRLALARDYPAIAELAHHVRFSVDAEYVPDSVIISESSQVACIPPVSGG
jgi:molybdopterin converting factor subunit 1